MTGRRPPFLAVIEPEAAEVILRMAGDQLRKYARQAAAYVGTPAEQRAGSVVRAVAVLEESARQWRAAVALDPVPDLDDAWLSTAEVAKELQVTVRRVGQLIRGGDGPLEAVLVKGAWRVRREDLDDYRRLRSEVAG